MKEFNRDAIERAMHDTSRILSVEIDQHLYSDYVLGRIPDLLTHERMLVNAHEVTAIQKYLISIQSALNQPVRFYDIYRNSRFSMILCLLTRAIIEFELFECGGWDNIRDRLSETIDLEAFDSTAFEIFVAASYRKLGYSVKFIEPQGGEKSPDLLISRGGDLFYAECKRINRLKQSNIDFRKNFRNEFQKLKPLLIWGKWITIDLDFKANSQIVNLSDLGTLLKNCLVHRQNFEDTKVKIQIRSKQSQELSSYLLHPSPKFDLELTGFEMKKHHGHFWLGISKPYDWKAYTGLGGSSSWIDSISSSIGLKYRLLNKTEIENAGFIQAKRIFEGLDQLTSVCKEGNSNLHVWVETDLPNGSRKKSLKALWEQKILNNTRDNYNDIVISETMLEVSVEGEYKIKENRITMNQNNWRFCASEGAVVPEGVAYTSPF